MIYSFTAEPAAYKLSLTLNFFNPEEIDLEAFVIVPVLRFCLDDDEALFIRVCFNAVHSLKRKAKI